MGGYLDPSNLNDRREINSNNPLLLNIAAANGSGKDEFLIAPFNVWFALTGNYNLSVNTSASFEQLKFQTEVHIRNLIGRANKLLGPTTFLSREFYHTASTGSEIKLFATDEAGRAEGYHPRTGGRMAITINEAKTVEEDIFGALSRCTGYSYWNNISSPGIKSGSFYRECTDSIYYPNSCQLGRGYFRRISAFDCPHIPATHIEKMIKTRPKEWVDSSIHAYFTDFGADIVIHPSLWEKAGKTPVRDPYAEDYCLGGDLAAGGDECCLYLRRGHKVIDKLFFTEADTTLSSEIIHEKFSYILSKPYTAVMDDGGIGKAIIDNLVKFGWNILRRHNQAAAGDRRAFLNFGAQSYFHLRSLLENNLIQPSLDDPTLNRQVTSRVYEQQSGGSKFRLEDKKEHKSRLRESPDRADAYVLCFSTLPINLQADPRLKTRPALLGLKDFEEQMTWGRKHLDTYDYKRNTNRRRSFIAKL